ncbi:PREDICTED: hydroxyacid oxidase 2-like [Branchiostoma belcheri]|uniref:(S)-2-hydroxy-acid oxidase n=1 Tax=Branchiostoma belcheri TaxID=7741 RepID=A0A6P4YWR5_BRABE|nr:PREDICTED: hydroxyacid oxidase 2-like [Branchiostoma belcheri]
MSSDSLVCLRDFEKYAEEHLDRNAWGFFSAGAEGCQTLRDNEEAFRRLRLRPRFLRDVSVRDMSTTVLGQRIDMPIGISPTANQGLASPEGEIGTAKAAAQFQTCMICSTYSNFTMEDIMNCSPHGLKWFQLYVRPDRETTAGLVRRAERAGYRALVLTVDLPIVGRRYPDLRHGFSMPPHLKVANLRHVDLNKNKKDRNKALDYGFGGPDQSSDSALSWKDVAWLRSISTLPIILKGILTAEDARLAVQQGVDGILVSNHGGRQLDGVPATIEALPEIVEAAGEKLEVYMDGGVRTGTDVLKALALGARAVFIGRPAVWGLCYKGQEGVAKVLNILKEELSLAMALSGCSSLGDITPGLVVRESQYSRL